MEEKQKINRKTKSEKIFAVIPKDLKERVISTRQLNSMIRLYKNTQITKDELKTRVLAQPNQLLGTLDYFDITGEEFEIEQPT